MLLQAKQMHKMTTTSLKMVEVVILSVAQFVTTVIFFSALNKLRVKWDNSRKPTQLFWRISQFSLHFYYFLFFVLATVLPVF